MQTTTQLTQTTNVIIPPQNTNTTATLNTMTQIQNTTTLPNIFNLMSQQMRMITGATAGGSNQQNNATSNVNTRGEYFTYFGTIGANLIEGLEAFGNNNNNPPSGNNNNNNLSPPLPPPRFGGELGGDFNPPSGGNAGGLDLNVAALVNTLTGANLEVNHVERESNHVKLTEFGGIEAEDPNEWLECYNRIAKANKWSEHKRFQIIGGYLVGAAARWYDEIKTFITSWGYFQHVFLTKFASPARKNNWYLKYKSCKQVGRTIDEYAIDFQANWRKDDERRTMPANSVLADFMSGLDLNISMLLYGLVLTNLNEVIMKAKMIEMGQKNASGVIQVNAKMTQLETENQVLQQQLAWEQATKLQSQPQPQT